MQRMNPSGVIALLGLVENISIADGGNAAFLVTDLYGGTPDTDVTSYHGNNPDENSGEIMGDAFSKTTFSLSLPGPNGRIYYDRHNVTSGMTCYRDKGGDSNACMAASHALIDSYGMMTGQLPTRQEFEEKLQGWVNDKDPDATIRVYTTINCVPEYIYDSDDLYTPAAYNINGCLAVKGEESCQLLYSPPICLAIIFAMTTKLVVILLTMRAGHSRKAPLLVIGDAIASFMENADCTTEGFCWALESDFRRGEWKMPKAPDWLQDSNGNADFPEMQLNHKIVTFGRLQKRKRWMQVPSLIQWLVTMTL